MSTHPPEEPAVILPAALAAALPPVGTISPAARRGRVLVVDDEADVRELVALKLTDAGLTVSTAADGPTALAMVAAERPDLVVLDIMMPGPNGLEICRRLRADPATASLPVLLLTARAQENLGLEALAAGANCYMGKPFSPRQLLANVDELLTAA